MEIIDKWGNSYPYLWLVIYEYDGTPFISKKKFPKPVNAPTIITKDIRGQRKYSDEYWFNKWLEFNLINNLSNTVTLDYTNTQNQHYSVFKFKKTY